MTHTTIVIRLALPACEDESYGDWLDRISRRVCGRCAARGMHRAAQRLEEMIDERSLEDEPGYWESTRPYLF